MTDAQQAAGQALADTHGSVVGRSTAEDGTITVDVFGDLDGALSELFVWLGAYEIAPDGSVSPSPSSVRPA